MICKIKMAVCIRTGTRRGGGPASKSHVQIMCGSRAGRSCPAYLTVLTQAARRPKQPQQQGPVEIAEALSTSSTSLLGRSRSTVPIVFGPSLPSVDYLFG